MLPIHVRMESCVSPVQSGEYLAFRRRLPQSMEIFRVHSTSEVSNLRIPKPSTVNGLVRHPREQILRWPIRFSARNRLSYLKLNEGFPQSLNSNAMIVTVFN
jgi:hypothetical protein